MTAPLPITCLYVNSYYPRCTKGHEVHWECWRRHWEQEIVKDSKHTEKG